MVTYLKVRFWYQWGLMLRFHGLRTGQRSSFQGAERAFSQALTLDPAFYRAQFSRGLLYWRELGNPQKAVGDFTAILQQNLPDDDYAETLLMRGMAYQAMGHYEAAVDDMENYLRLKPDSHSVNNVLSQLNALYTILDDMDGESSSQLNSGL